MILEAFIKEVEPYEPWAKVDADGQRLEAELKKEVGPKHQLFGKLAKAIARRADCDDVLFEIAGDTNEYAVVHLTWSGSTERDPRWPATTLFSSLDAWRDGCMPQG
jgi:hypothetical protein